MPDPKLKIFHLLKRNAHIAAPSPDIHNAYELRYLFLEVTRRCDLHCRYCARSCPLDSSDASELQTNEWIRIVDHIADDFDPSRIMVSVTGGEPLIKTGIFDLFRHLHEKGFHYGVVTNATHLDAVAAEKIVEFGLESISLSCDSIPEVNDRIRGPGASCCIEHAIEYLHEAGYGGILEILSTVTKPCMPHLGAMQQWVMDHGITRWRLSPVLELGTLPTDLRLNGEDVKVILDFIRGNRRSLGEYLRMDFSEEGFLGEQYEGHVRPYLCQCRAGTNIGGIRCDGRIGACPELPAIFDQGDIHEDRFLDVWNSRYQVYRDRSWTRNSDPCHSCNKFRYCHGGAMHLYADTQSPPSRCLYCMLNTKK